MWWRLYVAAYPLSHLHVAFAKAQVDMVKMKIHWLLNVLLLSTLTVPSVCQELVGPAVTPKPRIEQWWFARHADHVGLFKDGSFDLLMVGDSITQNFETVGESVWTEHFGRRRAINLGFGGDRTNHVLWRLDHLPKLKEHPKAAVVLIGTNNICWGSDKPKQAAMGVAAVATKLHALYADMEILVLGVFPRRREASHPHRKQVRELNAALPALLDPIERVTFLDIGARFLDDKGHLSEEMMPDTTHPSERGHRVWAEAITPILDRMLGGQKSMSLMQRFGHLIATMGKANKDKARVLSRPKKVQLKRGQAPGKTWKVQLGKSRFRVSIEDVTGLEIDEALRKLERVPPLYLRSLEIVSEKGKDGIAFYADLGGAAAHGGQEYLNILHRVGAEVVVHEAGHIMEQRAKDTEPDILKRWGEAIEADGVSVSPYGDRVVHEDQAEFARVYALCLDGGVKYLKRLKQCSPARYVLWEQILRLAKAN